MFLPVHLDGGISGANQFPRTVELPFSTCPFPTALPAIAIGLPPPLCLMVAPLRSKFPAASTTAVEAAFKEAVLALLMSIDKPASILAVLSVRTVRS